MLYTMYIRNYNYVYIISNIRIIYSANKTTFLPVYVCTHTHTHTHTHTYTHTHTHTCVCKHACIHVNKFDVRIYVFRPHMYTVSISARILYSAYKLARI